MLSFLHLSFHMGCHNELMFIGKELGIKITYLEFNDGTKGKYNLGNDRAQMYWNKHQEYFNNFDGIIISDTTPISRVFLQNNWSKFLIIWINNRFDYYDVATLDCNFPDEDYYNLIKKAILKDRIFIFGYTPFENYYCKNIRNIDIGNLVIKPTGNISNVYKINNSTSFDLSDTYFIGPYHNDNIMIKLAKKIESLGFKVYNGRFNGPLDLLKYKAVIHIPYAWSNYTFFEGINLGIVYYIPTKRFLFELKENKDFFWSPPFNENLIELSEWYLPEHKNLLIYFDSWTDLNIKLYTVNLNKQRRILNNFSKDHTKIMIDKWKKIFNKCN